MILSPHSTRDCQLPLWMKRLLRAGRGQNDRAGELRTKNLAGGIELAHVYEPPRPQLEPPERLPVRPQGELVLNPHRQVGVVGRTQPPFRDRLEIEHVDGVRS